MMSLTVMMGGSCSRGQISNQHSDFFCFVLRLTCTLSVYICWPFVGKSLMKEYEEAEEGPVWGLVRGSVTPTYSVLLLE